jgi:hypothetical protein
MAAVGPAKAAAAAPATIARRIEFTVICCVIEFSPLAVR